MIRKEVVSSAIKSIGHNYDTLEIEFLNGSVYQYFPITSMIYDDLMKASSKHEYFKTRIEGSCNSRKVNHNMP